MTVTPDCDRRFHSPKDLYQFLLTCQPVSRASNHPQIISFSFAIDPVDPLQALHQIARADQFSFYFEKQPLSNERLFQTDGMAIAAIGTACQFQVDGATRFEAAKAFVQATLAHTTIVGNSRLPLAGPHFVGGFTFFDQASSSEPYFAPATLVLPEWQISHQQGQSTVVLNLSIDPDHHLDRTVERTWQQLQTIRTIKADWLYPTFSHRELLKKQDVRSTSHFKILVQSALQAIQAHALHKVVLAHAVDVMSPLPFSPIASLRHLRQIYPDCYIFAMSNGRGQQFIGASPERLVSLRDRHLMTDALAGSAARGKTTCEDAYLASSLLSSKKETHEHRVVTKFITHQLRHLGLTPHVSPLRLLQLSNIQHLRTPIHATLPTDLHLLDVVAALHPTPAVAGMPRAIACDHIRRYEGFERSLYAAPLGWIDHQGNGEFAVGIRSALMDGCHARLYAGAGIVAGSDPERELLEVQIKLQALLAALI